MIMPIMDEGEYRTFTVRLPLSLIEFLDRQARLQYNTRTGILRQSVAAHAKNLEPEGTRRPRKEPALSR
jgi:hypothetical protein